MRPTIALINYGKGHIQTKTLGDWCREADPAKRSDIGDLSTGARRLAADKVLMTARRTTDSNDLFCDFSTNVLFSAWLFRYSAYGAASAAGGPAETDGEDTRM